MRLFALIVALLFAVPASAWWDEAWSGRSQILIDTTPTGADIQAPLESPPVLLRLHSGNFPNFLTLRDGGADFRLIAGDDVTPLKFHIERFDPVSQLAYIWAQVGQIAPQNSEQKLFLYFGNPAAMPAAAPAETYGPDHAAVFHFDEAQGLTTDSTAYGTVVTSGEMYPNTASLIGHGALLAGTEPLRLADAPHLRINPATGWTASLWVRFDEIPDERVYVIDRESEDQRLSLTLESGIPTLSLGATRVAADAPLAAARWQRLSVTLTSSVMRLYVDGLLAAETAVELTPMDGEVVVGGAVDGANTMAAAIDELEISTVARSEGYLAFTTAVQGERNNDVLAYLESESVGNEGEPAAEGGHSGGHFAVIIQNVFGRSDAIIEQIVIGVCVLMMALAMLVMVVKGITLQRARGSSNRFLAAYKDEMNQQGEGPSTIDALYEEEQRFGDSPLFRVYREGIDQLRSRVSMSVGAQSAGLQIKSVNAIRASLDSTMVRESQRMNSLLVLLTIAISGGPFIGLLGTVVGVMITFAAIAATGDVNIAAIAPGMAAALLATVAGLGVAIPSLFGYNYLSAQVKGISADMTVFADEFMAVVNEVYGA